MELALCAAGPLDGVLPRKGRRREAAVRRVLGPVADVARAKKQVTEWGLTVRCDEQGDLILSKEESIPAETANQAPLVPPQRHL